MDESRLKSDLVIVLRRELRRAMVLRHENRPGISVGSPDLSNTWQKITTWLEIKYANPAVKKREAQHLVCQALAREGYCYYVIYYEATKTSERRTVIIHPDHLDIGEPRVETAGFSHLFVAGFIRRGFQP